VRRIHWPQCVMLAALGCLSIGHSQASEDAGRCESIYPGAVSGNHATGTKLCSVEWLPGTVEHVNDFAAQCRNLAAGFYVDFVHDAATGRVACLFKPAFMAGQPPDRMALLQRAWLNRARDLSTVRAQFVERLAAASHMQKASPPRGCAFDPLFDGPRCRTRPAPPAQEIAPAANRTLVPVAKGKAANQFKSTRAAAIAGAAKAKKTNRRKNFSRIEAAAKKAKAQSFKLAVAGVTPTEKRRLKAAAAKWKGTKSAAASNSR
jgi:hypothetical protein